LLFIEDYFRRQFHELVGCMLFFVLLRMMQGR
jgi:hypothetical protein